MLTLYAILDASGRKANALEEPGFAEVASSDPCRSRRISYRCTRFGRWRHVLMFGSGIGNHQSDRVDKRNYHHRTDHYFLSLFEPRRMKLCPREGQRGHQEGIEWLLKYSYGIPASPLRCYPSRETEAGKCQFQVSGRECR